MTRNSLWEAERQLTRIRRIRAEHEELLRDLVRAAAEAGASTEAIAAALGVSRATLWRRYPEEVTRSDKTGRGPR